MCLIMFKEVPNSVIPESIVESSAGKNDDSAGVMFVQNGRLFMDKLPAKGREGIIEFTKKYLGEPGLAIHHRFTTHGSNCIKNTHPHPLLSIDDGDPIDLAVMHNGVISTGGCSIKGPEDDSDTRIFLERYVKPILKEHPELLHTTHFQGLLEGFIGGANKLLFLDNQGRSVIINESMGAKENGVWFSNKGSHYTPPAATTYYGRGGNSWNKNNSVYTLGKPDGDEEDPPGQKTGGKSVQVLALPQRGNAFSDRVTHPCFDAFLNEHFTKHTNLMTALEAILTAKNGSAYLDLTYSIEDLSGEDVELLTLLIGPAMAGEMMFSLAEECTLDPLYSPEDELEELEAKYYGI